MVTPGQLKLKCFLHRNDAFSIGNRSQKCCEHRCFPRLGSSRDENALALANEALQKMGSLQCERTDLDKVGKLAQACLKLSNIDGPVFPGDVGNNDVESGAIGKRGINERLRHIDSPPGVTEHSLDQPPHFCSFQFDLHSSTHPCGRHKHRMGAVDPHFLDLWVI